MREKGWRKVKRKRERVWREVKRVRERERERVCACGREKMEGGKESQREDVGR